MRRKIPKNIEKKLLVMNRHCCCICGIATMHKPVAIHHIDGNNSNNKVVNLAVLCLDHHSMADSGLVKGKVGAGKKLSPEYVKEYKRLWESKVEATSNLPKKTFPLYQKKHLQIFYQFEIRRRKTEIAILPGNDKRIKENFQYFGELLMEELTSGLPVRKFLLEAYDDLVVPGWVFDNVTKAKLLA